jgi:hypothetical protein
LTKLLKPTKILIYMAISATPSQAARALLTARGRPLDFEAYKPLTMIYDVDPDLLVILAGRQCGKTLGVGAIITIKSILRKHFISLYISPLSQQTSRFSSMYLDAFFQSPLVRKHFRGTDTKKNVGEKSLNNGSIVYLSYVETEADADRARGIASDSLYIDEAQDVSMEALPVLYETLSASYFGFKRITGTAKTLNNTLTNLFNQTNQLYWVVKCPGCGRHNIPNTFDSCMRMCSRDEGPSCMFCGHLVDMRTGVWTAARPTILNKFGFSLPQFIVPFRTGPKKWAELREKISGPNAYTVAKMSNEVFGLPIGHGGRILSQDEAMACSDPNKREWDNCWAQDARGIISIVIGVDWSVTASEKSFTVISVLGYDYMGKCYLMYSQRVNGTDILEQVARVEQLYYQFNAQAIGSDRGVGVLQCQLLQKSLGPDKVFPVNYVNSKVHLRYDRQGGFFAADRTMIMDTLFLKMKVGRRYFETPAWSITAAPFWSDCLSIFEEETMAGKRVFRHDEDIPDDSFHSVVFGHVAHMVMAGEYTYVNDAIDKVNEYKV